ncbi:MAG: DNA topoisomerase IV subunit B [Cyanobacteriota bacterium]
MNDTEIKTEIKYDENAITTLSSLDHIRLRSGMYIGRLGNGTHPDDGIYVLIKEVIDNAIDEYIMGNGKKVEISITEKEVSIRDYGRGIPLGKVIDCVSKINTGAKYNTNVFQFTVGLNGVGTKAVNALSSSFFVKSVRDGEFFSAYFEKGILISQDECKTEEETGTFVKFTPDESIFGAYLYNQAFLTKRFWYYAYLNIGLKIKFNGERFYSKQGLFDLLEKEVGEQKIYPQIYYKSDTLEFSFTHISSYGENYISFVNGQHTINGGTHQSAFREGILKGINEYSKKDFQGADIREGIFGTIAIKVQDPIFESQTKNKLGNNEIRSPIIQEVKTAVEDFLHKNKPVADRILDKILFNEKLRKELQNVKKVAKERAKRVSIKIPNLKDCKYHLNDNTDDGKESMIFITEGQSASGSIVVTRNVYTQAVFPLKGKPMNCFETKLETVYKNDELYNIMQSLGIEESIDNLRYNKVVIATDADVDGLHIRNLLITYFLQFFEAVVLRNHLYILETPLFRVRNKKETIYCYSEKERDLALKKLKNNSEITRFKGLGEISPSEFGQFIGKDIRLIPVSVDEIQIIPKLLGFYMGKNTPERKNYIMNKLI